MQAQTPKRRHRFSPPFQQGLSILSDDHYPNSLLHDLQAKGRVYHRGVRLFVMVACMRLKVLIQSHHLYDFEAHVACKSSERIEHIRIMYGIIVTCSCGIEVRHSRSIVTQQSLSKPFGIVNDD